MIKSQEIQKQINLMILDIFKKTFIPDQIIYTNVKKLEELMEQYNVSVDNDSKFWQSMAKAYREENLNDTS